MTRTKIRPAISYTRVSTVDQGMNGIGLEGQRRAINCYADSAGYTIVDSFSDVASGAGERNLERRPGLQQAILSARARRIPIILSGLDRLSRNTRTIEQIITERGIEVISATEGRMDNPVTIASKAARAQYDRDMISEHTKKALAEKKRQGVKLGNLKNLPEAQKKGAARNRDRAAAKVEEIAEVIQKIPGWQDLTAADVVKALNDLSIRTSRGSEWTLSSLRRPWRTAKQQIELEKKTERVKDLAKVYKDNPNFGRF